jgi:putative inorganic carbon (HCO3(-)) transporter
MLTRERLIWLYSSLVLFIALNTYVLFNQNYYFYLYNFLPGILLCISLAFFSIDKLFMLAVFVTPLAINLRDMDIGLSLSLPSEPMLLGITIMFIANKLYTGQYDARIAKHPVSIAIYFNLFWILMTTITSELPLVSIKFLIARIWFVVSFYFLGVEIFKNFSNINKFNWLYMSSLIIVVIYTIICHAQFGFDEKVANWIMTPFYNDHTAYAVVLAMFFPVLLAYLFYKPYSAITRIIVLAVFALFCVAIVLSYTRAAWVSIIAALAIYITLLLRIRFKILLLTAIALVSLFLVFKTDIILFLEKNRQDASSDFAEHIQSITNISSDASNRERLNRWNCAMKMFDERPFWGWGPGVYSFVYAPFQEPKDRTIISTNFGNGGNAHSEYIGPLCESGVLGSLSFIVIVLLVISTGYKIYFSKIDKKIKGITVSLLLGLITYFVHGGLNNFLDTDKASAPFWGFIAMLVAIDIYHKDKKVDTLEKPAAE